MSAIPVTYPVTPVNVDESVIKPSATFKSEVYKVLFSILFFVLVYVFLMAGAILLAVLCAIGGFYLVVALPKLITLVIGVGLICVGGLVVFFLLKFLFKSNKTDRSHLIEVKERDQPELFAFIRTLTRETKAPFPKKIYLSPEVNASVFYDSSFWSMFFPIRKNLQIGLGLVNSVNLSEFKAILAHEFGHFSQRSMKLGSYVYNVNQIIFNLLYDNEGYGKTLQGFANINGYFAFFASLTAKIISVIQWILGKVYGVVNMNYMSLSREMEFHADSVAAYVTGSDHLATSLRRIEVADTAYNKLFEYYDQWLKDNLKPDNVYPQHSEMMLQFATDYDLQIVNGLPQVTKNSFAQFNKSRIVVKDQWASHPSTDDREAHLQRLNIYTEANQTPAWNIFRDKERLQEQITEKIYSKVTFANAPQTLDFVSFRQKCAMEIGKYRIDKRYKGFYATRTISETDLRNIETAITVNETSMDQLLTDEILNLPHEVAGLQADIDTLGMIVAGTLSVKTFDFDGKRYKKRDAGRIVEQLKSELSSKEEQLKKADQMLMVFFLNAAAKHGKKEHLRAEYSEMFQLAKSAEEATNLCRQLFTDLQPIYYGPLEFSQINQIMHKVKLHEALIKDRFRSLLDNTTDTSSLSAADRTRAEAYLAKEHLYFREPDFNEDALTLLNDGIAIFGNLVNERAFQFKKKVLEEQLTFI